MNHNQLNTSNGPEIPKIYNSTVITYARGGGEALFWNLPGAQVGAGRAYSLGFGDNYAVVRTSSGSVYGLGAGFALKYGKEGGFEAYELSGTIPQPVINEPLRIPGVTDATHPVESVSIALPVRSEPSPEAVVIDASNPYPNLVEDMSWVANQLNAQ